MRNWEKRSLMAILSVGCKKPYNPVVITAPNHYLVVEGMINSGSDSDTVLINTVQPPGAPVIIGYTYATRECVDCRAKTLYVTNIKPPYWPY